MVRRLALKGFLQPLGWTGESSARNTKRLRRELEDDAEEPPAKRSGQQGCKPKLVAKKTVDYAPSMKEKTVDHGPSMKKSCVRGEG